MTVSAKDIRLAYQLFLDRKASAAEVARLEAHRLGLDQLRTMFLRAPEFTRKYDQLRYGDRAEAVAQAIRHATQDITSAELLASGSPRIVFLHIRKCGGTTLHLILGEWYGHDRFHPERFNGLYTSKAAELASRQVFSGHFDYYSTAFIPGPKTLVSLLRDPVERLVSLYNFQRAHDPESGTDVHSRMTRWANAQDIDAFFTNPEIRADPAINNAYARSFSDIPQIMGPFDDPALQAVGIAEMLAQALRNLERFAFIGFIDEYDRAIERLASLLGQAPPAEVKKAQVLDDLMTSHPGLKTIPKQQPSPATLTAMEALVGYDRLVYARAREIFLS